MQKLLGHANIKITDKHYVRFYLRKIRKELVGITKHQKGYRARIKGNNISISLGVYYTKEEAAEAYNKAALLYFGKQLDLNKV